MEYPYSDWVRKRLVQMHFILALLGSRAVEHYMPYATDCYEMLIAQFNRGNIDVDEFSATMDAIPAPFRERLTQERQRLWANVSQR